MAQLPFPSVAKTGGAARELCTFAFIEGAFAENLAELDDTLMIFNNFVIKT